VLVPPRIVRERLLGTKLDEGWFGDERRVRDVRKGVVFKEGTVGGVELDLEVQDGEGLVLGEGFGGCELGMERREGEREEVSMGRAWS